MYAHQRQALTTVVCLFHISVLWNTEYRYVEYRVVYEHTCVEEPTAEDIAKRPFVMKRYECNSTTFLKCLASLSPTPLYKPSVVRENQYL